MKITTKNQLIEHNLKDIYSAENQLVIALTEMAVNATYSELKEALEMHKNETEEHIARIEEGKKALDEIEGEDLKDMAIVGSGQRAEHYEIAVYEDLIMHLQYMDQAEAAELLAQNLEEEEAASEKLTEIGELCAEGEVDVVDSEE